MTKARRRSSLLSERSVSDDLGSGFGGSVLQLIVVAFFIGLATWYGCIFLSEWVLDAKATPDWVLRYLRQGIVRLELSLAAASVCYAALLFIRSNREARERESETRWPERTAQGIELLIAELTHRRQARIAPLSFAAWALPVLGFIGTVAGISRAIEGFSAIGIDGGKQQGFSAISGGLHIAFDTTLTGLVLAVMTTILFLALSFRLEAHDARFARKIEIAARRKTADIPVA